MENNEESRIQEAEVFPETKLEESFEQQKLGSILESQAKVESSMKALNKAEKEIVVAGTKPEEAISEVAVESAESGKLKVETLPLKKEPSFKAHLAMLFLLGFLIGIALKTEALKKITVGYDDYLMKIKPQSYNINDIQAKLEKQMEQSAAQSGGVASGSASDSSGAAPDQGVDNNSQSNPDNAPVAGNASDQGTAPVLNSGQTNQGNANEPAGN